MATTITKFAHLQIPLEYVIKATYNFDDDNIIGRGGIGPIYKGGLMRSGKVMKVAVLRLDRKQGQGDVEFWTEVSMLSDLKHTNIVSIVGFCDEKNEKIIITRHAAKGSLSEHLNSSNLTWTQRLTICVGVARAMSYLQYDEERGYGVIHLNINSSSILLDENFEAKLSGFKVSVKQSLNRTEQVILSEPIGTRGYVDPEIEKTKGVTPKSDIYSFGVVLFELLCGRRAYNKNEANKSLAQLVKYHYKNETLQDIIHPDLRNQMSPYSLRIYSRIAYACLEKEGADRPHILNIVDKLQKALKKALKFQPHFEKNLENLKIQLNDIKSATHNFSDTYKIKSNDYYTWYKVELDQFNREKPSSLEGTSKRELLNRHNTVVIKRFLPIDDEQEEELFFTELKMLASVKHPRIVNLLGFCVEGSDMLLVIDKFSDRYLENYLGNVKEMCTLTWGNRLKICIDVAHALNYIHFGMGYEKTIIHNNINDAIIGFNENWEAKIEDFEWAVFLPPNKKHKALNKKTHFNSRYHVDPVYMKNGKVKRESDVYSFGVVLFEILCGRHANDQIYINESEEGLVDVARRKFCKGTVDDMIDPTLKEETKKRSIPNRGINKDSLQTFLKVANQCVAEIQDERPTMKVVLKELEKARSFQVKSTHQTRREARAVTTSYIFKEKRVQHMDMDQIAREPKIATHEILEERVQLPGNDQVVDELKITPHEIPGSNLKIPLADIKLATNDFSNAYKISSWNDYTLYRAELANFGKGNPSSVEGTVVIKRYPSGHKVFTKEAFFTEIEMLRNVKHPNIITLLGFCLEDSEMILVTENVSNGYLFDYLRNVVRLRNFAWEKRLKICIDVAHALSYLHYEMEDQMAIINRHIDCYNIGLDENLGAKIASFCFSVFMPPNQEDEALYPNQEDEPLYLNWISRYPYIDPEYKGTRKLKRESDVYSFGVVLFEILCGRSAVDPIYMKESEVGLARVARQCYRSGTIQDIIDPIIKEETSENSFVLNRGPNKDSLHTFIEIAYKCVAETQDQRPTIKVVVKELEKALFFQNNKLNNPRILLEDIKVATQNFSNCIGGGGFGGVFKGQLQDGDGVKTIVVKRLDKRLGQGEQQFWNEVQILLEYKHENVIGLIGYCDEKDEKLIVYEYAPKGSLNWYLKDASLTWVKRLIICIDVATALYFLHRGVGKQAKVIHRDIKTANILLNHEWRAKLGDFGLSLISPITQKTEYVIDHTCGTKGYVDPLYEKSRFLTIESDIYSFGVVLFEILCGISAFEIEKHKGQYLPDFIKENFQARKHDEVVFEQIRDQIVPKSLTTFQEIAFQCLHHEREKRPTTKKVLMELKKALEFQNMGSTMTKFAHLHISLEDVVKATNNFNNDNIIRRDGFSTTYEGRLLQSGELISARRFNCKKGEADLNFLTEISVLSDLNHTNLISIIGFCDEKDEKIIVTTYVNESLGQHLSSPSLTWTQRLRIGLGVARALSYLHYDKGRDYAIIHCKINSNTVLLDQNWEAKLSSFEVSIKQSVYKDEVCLYDHIGKMGYCTDPAIEKTGGVTHKSDIYSLGVVLFEMLCGRKAFVKNEAKSFLAPLAKYHYENKTLKDIIYHELRYRHPLSPQSLLTYSNIAYSCLNDDQTYRPHMDNVIDELEKALKLQLRRENIEKKFQHLKIPLIDIKLATDKFSDRYKIASWDDYTLYRAVLNDYDEENSLSKLIMGKNREHPKVIIKRYPSGDDVYGDDKFYTEIEMLSRVKHPKIVTLVGICLEGSEMILVTENVSNGYLCDYLKNVNDMRILSWEKRLKICIDVAHALKYLHHEMEDQKVIIHRDISSRSIALDENWGAKIVDFWWSLFLPPNQEDKSLYINWIGRPSYTDPRYKKTYKLKRESDVYNFGVVLFEILCGRSAPVARQSFSMGTLENMVDPALKEETTENSCGPNKDSLHTFIEIAHKCFAETQDQRPTMKVISRELTKALLFQLQEKKFPHLKIPLSDIKFATDNFSDRYKIASWDDYTLYRAELNHYDEENSLSRLTLGENREHPKVVIKRYPSGHDVYGEEKFYTEIEMLSSVKHPNIVTLLGICLESSEMILVTENVSNGYLCDYLKNVNDMRILSWEKRLKICFDVTHALKYLHHEMEDQKVIIHCDISSRSIALDENWGAKIVDFWWSLFLPPNEEVFLPPNEEDKALHLNWIGRPSYTDPEYKKTYKLKRESDVFSFGVVLFEILFGRSSIDPIFYEESDKGLASVARQLFCSGTLEDMIDPILKEETSENNIVQNRGPDKDSLRRFIEIAHKCVAETQDQRPTMFVVARELKSALLFQVPEKIKEFMGGWRLTCTWKLNTFNELKVSVNLKRLLFRLLDSFVMSYNDVEAVDILLIFINFTH